MITREIRVKTPAPLIVAAALVFLQIFSPTPVTKFVLWALVITVAISYVWVRLLAHGVVIKRQRRHGWAQVGDVLEERFLMHNHAIVPIPWAEILDYSNLPGYSAGRALSLGAHRFTRWEKRVVCTQRGVFSLGPSEVVMGDPFGLFEVSLRHNLSETFVVFPAIARIPQLVEPRGVSRGSGSANLLSIEETTNASSVRPYTPGDPLRRIHWRTTAKHAFPGREDLFVREFDIEPAGDVWIALDMHSAPHAGEGLVSTEEYAVILSASLTERLLSAHHAVGLVTYTEEPTVIWPQKGLRQLYEMLRILAGIHAVGQIPFDQVLNLAESVIGRDMTAVLITPSTQPAWVNEVPNLLLRGIHPTALLLDAGSFGGEDGSASGVVRALTDLGVTTQMIDRSLRLEEAAIPHNDREKSQETRTRPRRMRMRDEATWMPVGQRQGQLVP